MLSFAGYRTDKPIAQAKRHAKYLKSAIQKYCGFSFEVLPVVAVPGWHVDGPSGKCDGVLVINPKRARVLRDWLSKVDDRTQSDRVAVYLDSVVRSIPPGSRKIDPDANEHYDFWMNPRAKDKSID